jgi:nucleoside-diphosphate-sugar epimerase
MSSEPKMSGNDQHILVTGGAGYIGSLFTAELLRSGYRVTVVDDLLFGGEALVGFFSHPGFHFIKADVCEPGAVRYAVRRDWPRPQAIVHLAAIDGFPACQMIGRQAVWRYNVDAVQRVFEQAEQLGCERFVFSSTYSNYARAAEGGPMQEDAPLNPQSLYTESKIAAERALLDLGDTHCAPVIFRLATLFGMSPRTRFDQVVNQFVLEAFTRRELIIYQRGYSRSFVHVLDVARGLMLGLTAPDETVRGQVYNMGSESGNFTKDQVVALVIKRIPDTVIRYKDLSFGGDVHDILVSFDRIRKELGFETHLSVDDGIRELVQALRLGIIRDPHDKHYRNADLIIQ